MIGMFTGPEPASARFTTTVEQAVTAERHLGVRAAAALLVRDERDMALDVLLASVRRQARLSGCGRGVDLAGARS